MKRGEDKCSSAAITRAHINSDTTTYKPEQDQCSHCKNTTYTTHINRHNTGTESTAAEADTHTVIYTHCKSIQHTTQQHRWLYTQTAEGTLLAAAQCLGGPMHSY